MLKSTLHIEAQEEFEQSVEFYRSRLEELGKAFFLAVTQLIDSLLIKPEAYGWYDDTFREAPLKKFPYSVIYTVRPGGILYVIAIAHAKRKPGYWQDRGI